MDENRFIRKPLPRIDDRAPDFKARTTKGERSLKDYEGKWLVLFSHPADFTAVCTTEFLAFNELYDEFASVNCDLLGISVDSLFAHYGWLDGIKRNFNVDIRFPIIADLTMDVSQKFGMVYESDTDTTHVRAVFVIDPNSITRAIIYYPMIVGRDVSEVLRLVKALQVADEHMVATPESWRPGDACMVRPPATYEETEKMKEKGYNYKDWYYCKTDVDQSIIGVKKN